MFPGIPVTQILEVPENEVIWRFWQEVIYESANFPSWRFHILSTIISQRSGLLLANIWHLEVQMIFLSYCSFLLLSNLKVIEF